MPFWFHLLSFFYPSLFTLRTKALATNKTGKQPATSSSTSSLSTSRVLESLCLPVHVPFLVPVLDGHSLVPGVLSAAKRYRHFKEGRRVEVQLQRDQGVSLRLRSQSKSWARPIARKGWWVSFKGGMRKIRYFSSCCCLLQKS